mmetsp:Transcript_9568/g.29694  ORF Transcript_9568/g.29694 Transcript_9568/m.29694 type:complete len:207 (+) Transcript_9568:134-754(+)
MQLRAGDPCRAGDSAAPRVGADDHREHAAHQALGQDGDHEGRERLREVRAVQPNVEREGPPCHRRHRVGREERRAEARADGGRGLLGQHGHRPGHGLRGQGLPLRLRHVRELLRGAPQAHALPGRQGHPDEPRAQGLGHGDQGQGAGGPPRLVPPAAVRERGQRGDPRDHDGPRDPSGHGRPAHHVLRVCLRHRGHAQGRRQGVAG